MNELNPLLAPDTAGDTDEERMLDRSLRPSTLDDFIGQPATREQLETTMELQAQLQQARQQLGQGQEELQQLKEQHTRTQNKLEAYEGMLDNKDSLLKSARSQVHELKEKLNAAIETMKSDGSLNEFIAKWFPDRPDVRY